MKKKYIGLLVIVILVVGVFYSYNSEPVRPVKEANTVREERVTERLNYYYDQVEQTQEKFVLDKKYDATLGENYTAKIQVFSEDKIFYVIYVIKEGNKVRLSRETQEPDVTISVDEKLIGGEIQKNNLNAETVVGLFISQRIKVTPLTEIPKLTQFAQENADDLWLKLSGVRINVTDG